MQSSRFSPSEERGGWVDHVMFDLWLDNDLGREFPFVPASRSRISVVFITSFLLLVKSLDTKFYI